MANGKIKADTLEHSTAGSLDTKFVVNGSAKHIHYFNQVTVTINSSLNMSSITDVGAGMYDPQLTNTMGSTTYSVFAHASAEASNDTLAYYGYNRATGSYRRYNNDSGARDLNNSDGMLLGDLA